MNSCELLPWTSCRTDNILRLVFSHFTYMVNLFSAIGQIWYFFLGSALVSNHTITVYFSGSSIYLCFLNGPYILPFYLCEIIIDFPSVVSS
jgi:hypothetical protein